MDHKEIVFKLEARQVARIREWALRVIGQQAIDEAFKEDCSCASPFTYEFTPTGICTITKVRGFGKVLDVTIDDDGVMNDREEFQSRNDCG